MGKYDFMETGPKTPPGFKERLKDFNLMQQVKNNAVQIRQMCA